MLLLRYTCCFEKILDQYNLLYTCCLNGLHEEYQLAYKIFHSTETALFRVQHDISSELVKNRAMLFVMLDLSSAFDTINHEHLLTCTNTDVLGRPHPLCPDRLKNIGDYSVT